jgi:hypothetical protein
LRVRQLQQAAPEPTELDREVADRGGERRRCGAVHGPAIDGAVLERGEHALDALGTIEQALALAPGGEGRDLGHADRLHERVRTPHRWRLRIGLRSFPHTASTLVAAAPADEGVTPVP